MTQDKGVVFLITSFIASPIYAKALTDGGYTVANLVANPRWQEDRLGVLKTALEAHQSITPKAAVIELNYMGRAEGKRTDVSEMLALLAEQKSSLAILTDTQIKPFEKEVKGLWRGPLRTVDATNPDLNLRAEIDALLNRASLGETEKGF